MGYVIVGIIIIVILCSVLKWLLNFLLEHWQIPVGGIGGFFLGGIVGVILGIALMYLLTLIFRWIDKCIRRSNEKKFNNYLENKCSQLGFVTVEQLASKTTQFSQQNFESSYNSILQRFINNSMKAHYESNNIKTWNGVRSYLEQWFNYNMGASSIDIKEICDNCDSVFMWTRNKEADVLLLDALKDKSNGLFNTFDIQKMTIDGVERTMVSSLEKVTTLDGDEWED